jgi:hypothetical protein
MDKLLTTSAEERSTAKIEQILPHTSVPGVNNGFPFSVNGLWLFLARPGSGKTHTYYNMLIELDTINRDIPIREHESYADFRARQNEPFFETVALCSKTADLDKTVSALSPGIRNANFITIDEDRILDWLQSYRDVIVLYNSVMRFIRSGFSKPDNNVMKMIRENRLNKPQKIIDYMEALLDKLGWKQYPHRMLLIMDDAANSPLLKQKDGVMMDVLRTLRHLDITVIICIQAVKDTPKDVKRLMTDAVLFPGIAEYDFIDLIRESTLGWLNAWEAWYEYSNMSGMHAKYVINNSNPRTAWISN